MSLELLYIFISDYGNIKEQGFNLSSKFKFTYEAVSADLQFKINPNISSTFFNRIDYQKKNEATILNITGIVGENGSGKSTLIEFICDCFRIGDTFNPTRDLSNDLLILKEDEFLIFIYKNKIGSIPIPNDDIKILLSEIHYHRDYLPKDNLTNHLIPLYYSTTMHDRVTRLGLKEYELINVSDLFCYYETNIPVVVDRSRDTSYNRLNSPSGFKYEDTQRQLQFVEENNKNNFVDISFCKQTYFGLSFSQSYTKISHFKNVVELALEKFIPQNDFDFFNILIGTSIIARFVYPDEKDFKGVNHKENFEPLLKGIIEDAPDFLTACERLLKKHPFNKYLEELTTTDGIIKQGDFRIQQKIDFVDFIKNNFLISSFKFEKDREFLDDFNRFKRGERFFNPYTYFVNVDVGSRFVEFYKDQLIGDFTPDFLEFKWSGLSSGQIAYLNLFSRFYHGYNTFFKNIRNFKNVRNIDKQNDILVIIDEGEVYFHPQWQKQYVKSILDFFRKLCVGKNVQIIIASNSPFITSDLPKSSVVFLKKDENNNCKVSDNADHAETFGANIHRLFKDAFYLKNGFIGEFAKEQIQFVIDFLDQNTDTNNLVQKELELAHTIISNIGEPIIKEKLIEMWNSKFEKFNDKN